MAERAEREANEAASKAEARAAELKRELKRTMEVIIQCMPFIRSMDIRSYMYGYFSDGPNQTWVTAPGQGAPLRNSSKF